MEWMKRANCLDSGLKVEFLEMPAADQVLTCNACPVRRPECLEYARRIGATGVVMAGLELGKRPLKSFDNAPVSA